MDESLDLLEPDGVDGGEHLVHRQEGAEAELLLRQAVHAARGRLQRQDEVALEVILGAAELLGRDPVLLDRAQLLHERLEHLAEVGRVGARVDVEDSGVVERLRPGVHGVDEGLALAHLLEQPGRHAAPDDVVQEIESVALRRPVRDPRKPQDQVDLLEDLVHDVDAGVQHRGRAAPGDGLAPEVLEARGEQVHHPRWIRMPRRRHHDVRGGVLLLEVAQDRLPPEAPDRVRGAEDRPPERVVSPDPLGEEVVDEIVGRVLHHLDLLEHDRLLLLDVVLGEARAHQDVRQEVGGQGEVLVEHAHVETGVLLGGEGVHVPTDRVDRAGDLLGRPRGGPLEDQVLDQVGDPTAVLRLDSRAGLYPDTDGHRPHMRHRLRNHTNAVGQHMLVVPVPH